MNPSAAAPHFDRPALARPRPAADDGSRPSRRFAVIDETEQYMVVDKPPFLEAHPTKPGGRFTLWTGLRELLAYEIINGGQVSLINRLDRETSGLTLIAKHREAARTFHRLMEQRAIAKEYRALVWGWPLQDEFVVDAPLLRQGERQPSVVYLKRMVHPDGAPAFTRFSVETRFTRPSSNGSRFALLRAVPETGRTHQIRVHLAHAGFPIVGDKIYGGCDAAYLEFIRTGWTVSLAERLLLPRHALHSASLRITSRNLEWHAPLPADLLAWLPGS